MSASLVARRIAQRRGRTKRPLGRWLVALIVAIGASACAPSREPASESAAGARPAGGVPGAEPAPALASELDRELLASRIKRYFESNGQIGPEVASEIVAVEEADIENLAGLRRITLRLSTDEQRQDVDFLVSADGRWFLTAAPVDLTIDPVEQARATISIGPDDPYRGGAAAPVTIVEYSDFQCPFCARAETIVGDGLLREYGDRVKLVYKQMPLASIHPWAQVASEIGLCVFRLAGNDAYWRYHEAVFAKQEEVRGDRAAEQLLATARDAGADAEKVRGCLEAQETAPLIAATLEEAAALGVNSTPTFFINGRRLSGAQPLEAFRALIDPVLAAGSSSS